jgi:hypothetical protein
MDIFYASCWYNFYVFTIVPRDFYDSARDFYDSDPTAPIRYRKRHFFHAVECKPPAPAGAISVQKLKKKREKKKERRRNEIMVAPSVSTIYTLSTPPMLGRYVSSDDE